MRYELLFIDGIVLDKMEMIASRSSFTASLTLECLIKIETGKVADVSYRISFFNSKDNAKRIFETADLSKAIREFEDIANYGGFPT